MERPTGFEPASPGWQPRILPLDDGLMVVVGATGFEPAWCLLPKQVGDRYPTPR